ncbi:HD family phosphohydrolase [Desulfosarcina alkanivorans]|uniref:HD family phosphohydrolase n=1 Tax=Desulfosarcina alkanivorans TaxID=571177 RepID=A0A5K7YQK3_9BACT|nr:HD domain-containing phosphohydrolase [Desulfosarcina alkanivorans]BBO66887.1 HD family phosphohydrolase [Desulfosarcina alkanivorans]
MFNQRLRVNLADLAMSIAKVVDLMNAAVGQHHMQVAYWAYRLADALALPDEDKFDICIAGLLHDIGAFSLQERLDLLAFEDARPGEHAMAGCLILEPFEPFASIAGLIKFHHLPWKNGGGAFQDGVQVPAGSHLLHLADRVAVLISGREPVLAQVGDICASISRRSGEVFVPEHVDALMAMKHRAYVWLDAASDPMETVLKRTVPFPARELSAQDLVEFSKLLCRLIDFKSEFTATHSSGVAAVAVELARVTGFSRSERRLIEIAGYLHDLGKLAIPSEIIEKRGRLTENEQFIMRAHVYHTYQALEPFEALRPVNQWGSLHQERLNGTGYPFGLGGDDLPLGARIMAVADVFTALTEDRPYRKGMDTKGTMAVLQSMSDRDELDATLVARVFRHFDRFNTIRESAQQQAVGEYKDFHRILEMKTGSHNDG